MPWKQPLTWRFPGSWFPEGTIQNHRGDGGEGKGKEVLGSRGPSEKDWLDKELTCNAVTGKAQVTPQGALKQGWAFIDVTD